MMIPVDQLDYDSARRIVLWAIDEGLADGNPWVLQLAQHFGEDFIVRVRVWRRVAQSTFSEEFVYLNRFHKTLMELKYLADQSRKDSDPSAMVQHDVPLLQQGQQRLSGLRWSWNPSG